MVTQLKTKMPEVYNYVVAHLDKWSRFENAWHGEFASHVLDHFQLNWDCFEVVYRSIRIITFDKYGTYYPGRTASGAAGYTA